MKTDVFITLFFKESEGLEMTRQIEELKLPVDAPKIVVGKHLREVFKRLVAPGEYFEKDSKMGVRYPSFGRNVHFIVAVGTDAEIEAIQATIIYRGIWIKAEKSDYASEEDFVKDLNNPDLNLVGQAQNLRDGLSKLLSHDL